jgi:hypothetical protein
LPIAILQIGNLKSKIANSAVPVAQLDRASDFGSEGWGFESLQARHFSQFVAVIFWLATQRFFVRIVRGLSLANQIRCDV